MMMRGLTSPWASRPGCAGCRVSQQTDTLVYKTWLEAPEKHT